MPSCFASTRDCQSCQPVAGSIACLKIFSGWLLGDLLDVHTALGRRHHDDATDAAVEQHREVVLVVEREALLDEQALHLLALGARLLRDELHAEDLLDPVLGLGARLRDLHAAALTAATGVDLRLDDDDLGASPAPGLSGSRRSLLRRSSPGCRPAPGLRTSGAAPCPDTRGSSRGVCNTSSNARDQDPVLNSTGNTCPDSSAGASAATASAEQNAGVSGDSPSATHTVASPGALPITIAWRSPGS